MLRRAPDDSDGVGRGELRAHRIGAGAGAVFFFEMEGAGPCRAARQMCGCATCGCAAEGGGGSV